MSLAAPATASPPVERATLRVPLAGGLAVTVHLAVYPRAAWRLRVVAFPAPVPLAAWCGRAGIRHAITGGFFLTPDGPALGDLRVAGVPHPSTPVDPRFAAVRACLRADGEALAIGARDALPPSPGCDILQAGPRLVAAGRPAVRDGDDPEGFSAGRHQFDSDITDGRHPRAAVGVDGGRVILLASDGRADGEAGLTLGELAELLAHLGAEDALNLDGGGSAALVTDGALRNRPREADGRDIPGGRPIASALVLLPADQPASAAA